MPFIASLDLIVAVMLSLTAVTYRYYETILRHSESDSKWYYGIDIFMTSPKLLGTCSPQRNDYSIYADEEAWHSNSSIWDTIKKFCFNIISPLIVTQAISIYVIICLFVWKGCCFLFHGLYSGECVIREKRKRRIEGKTQRKGLIVGERVKERER